MTSRRGFLLGLAGMAGLAATPAYAQVWRKVCLADTLVADCPIYTPPVTGNGYFAAPTTLPEIDGLSFATTTSIGPFPYSYWYEFIAAVNSSSSGYVSGGDDGFWPSDQIIRFLFPTLTQSTLSATLAVMRGEHTGVNSSTRGYFGGGMRENYVITNEIDGIRFDTEAAINPAATIVVMRMMFGGLNSSTRGYFGGGRRNAVDLNEIDGISFSTETAINPAATLAVGRFLVTGVNSSTNGYFGAGGIASAKNLITAWLNEIDGIVFSSETSVNYAAALAVPRLATGGVNSSSHGYFGGGVISSYYAVNEIDGIHFATNSAVNPSASLTTARSYLAGFQSGGFL